MSTKLFNGHEIVGHTLESFLPHLRTLQSTLEPLAQQRATEVVTLVAVNAHDRDLVGLETAKSRNFLSEAEFGLMERQRNIKVTQRRDPVADYEFTVCLFPVDGRLLALTYTEQKAFKALWDVQDWRRDFAYWNNTDAPDDVSEQDWAERERLWDLVFKESRAPAELGYSFTLLPTEGNFLFAATEDVERFIPNVEKRVKALMPVYMDHLCVQAGRPRAQNYEQAMAQLQSDEAAQVREQLSEKLQASELTAKKLRDGTVVNALS